MKLRIPIASETVPNSNIKQVRVTVGQKNFWLRLDGQDSFLVLLDCMEEIVDMVEMGSLKDIRDFLEGVQFDIERKMREKGE